MGLAMGLDWCACDESLHMLSAATQTAENALFKQPLTGVSEEEIERRGHAWGLEFRANLLTHHVVGSRLIFEAGPFFFEAMPPVDAAEFAGRLATVAQTIHGQARWTVVGLRQRRDETTAILRTAALWLWFWSKQGCHIHTSW
jgi:hypothetical protein